MDMISTAVLVLLIANCYYYTTAQPVVNASPGIFSKKTESNGLTLPATSTFEPITTLTTTIHIDKPYTVFVHYQITLQSANKDFYSKLLMNHGNARSLVHSGNQRFKTATGFYMANLNLDITNLRFTTSHQKLSIYQLVGTGRLQYYK